MKARIITITLNPALDKSSSTERLIHQKKLRCTEPICSPGGGGLNISRVLKRMDVATETIYPEGDKNGKAITKLLQQEDIKPIAIKTSSDTRENFNITDLSSSKQYRFCMPGHVLEDSFYEKLYRKIEENEELEIVVLSGSMPPTIPLLFFKKLSDVCIRCKIKLIVDTSGSALESALKHKLFLIKPNLEEMAELLNMKEIKIEKAIAEARRIIEKGRVENIMLTNGAEGAWWISKNGNYFIKPPRVKVKSMVGAGDSALAGAVLGIIKNYPLNQVLKLGVAAGTATTLQEGTSLCEKKDVIDLFASIKNKSTNIEIE